MSWEITLIGSSSAETNSDLYSKINLSITGPYVSDLSMSYNGETTVSVTAISPTGPGINTFSAALGITAGNIDSNNTVTFSGTSNPSDYSTGIAALGSTFKINPTDGIVADGQYKIDYFLSGSLSGNTCVIDALGCQPSLLDESVEIKYWGGGYRKVKRARLQFKIKIKPYTTRGDWSDSVVGQKQYWDLMKVLHGNNIFISSFGSNFERITELIGLYPTEFTLPIAVEIFEFGELSPMFENNQDELSIVLVSKEWFTFT